MPVTNEEVLQAFAERFETKEQLDNALDRLILQDQRRLLEAAMSAETKLQAASNQVSEGKKQALQVRINAVVDALEANAIAAVEAAGGGG